MRMFYVILTNVLLIFGLRAFTQIDANKKIKGWHLLERKDESRFYGISLKKAYDFINEKKLKSRNIVVAVIDSGIDTLHEALKGILWRNPKEIINNLKDDDGNGYVDDINGWNFLGNGSGVNVVEDTYEYVREYYRLQKRYKYVQADEIEQNEKCDYNTWLRARSEMIKLSRDKPDTMKIRETLMKVISNDSLMQLYLGKNVYTVDDLLKFQPGNTEQDNVKSDLRFYFLATAENYSHTNVEVLKKYKSIVNNYVKRILPIFKEPAKYRQLVTNDDENDINDRSYGNSDIMADFSIHGTHVSGIIAADRTSTIQITGIADNVRIMMIRAIPDGDEHDKDVALSIRYAVDNGAKIINMSFAKLFSPQKSFLDEAVEYAENNGVLIIHAAGNNGINIDSFPIYPNPYICKSQRTASNWITVGASNSSIDSMTNSVIPRFSNYGNNSVDVFAPGINIYSSLPGNNYGFMDGTSMAAPVVTGIAALLFEYFPALNYKQVKYIIEKSTAHPDLKSNSVNPLIKFCKTGGIVNAYNAVRMAYNLTDNSTK